MTATVTTWHKVQVWKATGFVGWMVVCPVDECRWLAIAKGRGPDAWQSVIDKALAHVDETKEQT